MQEHMGNHSRDAARTIRHAVWRRRAYEVVELGRGEDRASALFDAMIVTLIVLNIAAFIAETVPEIEARYRTAFSVFEAFSVVVFTIEYTTRLWIAVEVPFLSRLPPWKARLTAATRPQLVIDLLAFLPYYLGALLSIDLRVLRVLRLLRFLKLSRYSPAMHALLRVLTNERRALLGAGLLLLAALLFASTGIYYIEGSAQPDKFGTVPDSAWWAMATLTTVGYGDVTPVTPLGRLFGGLVMVAGLCILALPVAIIASGFAQESGRRDFVVNWSLMSRIPLLAKLDSTEVADIMPLLHAHNLPPHVELLADGSQGDAMYFVASGRVRMTSEGHTRDFATGDVFGCVAMLENDLNRGSFTTASRCRLLKLHRADFHRLETKSPTVARRLREVASTHAIELHSLDATAKIDVDGRT